MTRIAVLSALCCAPFLDMVTREEVTPGTLLELDPDRFAQLRKAGVVTAAPPAPRQQVLNGSNVFPAHVPIGGQDVQLGTLVAEAFAASGLTEKKWNRLPDAERDALIQAAVDARVKALAAGGRSDPGAAGSGGDNGGAGGERPEPPTS